MNRLANWHGRLMNIKRCAGPKNTGHWARGRGRSGVREKSHMAEAKATTCKSGSKNYSSLVRCGGWLCTKFSGLELRGNRHRAQDGCFRPGPKSCCCPSSNLVPWVWAGQRRAPAHPVGGYAGGFADNSTSTRSMAGRPALLAPGTRNRILAGAFLPVRFAAKSHSGIYPPWRASLPVQSGQAQFPRAVKISGWSARRKGADHSIRVLHDLARMHSPNSG